VRQIAERVETTSADAPTQSDAGVTVHLSRAQIVREVWRWLAYIGLSALFLRPILTTAIFADDFVNPFAQYASVGLSPSETIHFAWTQTNATGHFNYLGQLIGTIYTAVLLWIASVPGIRFSTMYALLKLFSFIGVATMTAALLRETCRYIGREISLWRSQILVTVCLFSTLQIHIAWSNDPVGSYPLAGFVSALVGLAGFTATLVAVRYRVAWMPWLAAAVGAFSVVYYEINAAVVAASVLLLVLHGVFVEPPSNRWKFARYAAPVAVVPLVLVLLLQRRAAPQSGNYGGTSFVLGKTMVRTYGKNLVSSLPTAAWGLTREYLDNPLQLRVVAVVTFTVVAAVLATLGSKFGLQGSSNSWSGRRVLCVVLPLCAYWAGATLIQSSTSKVQVEVTRIGHVYNFYAIGAVVVALLMALAVHLAPIERMKAVLPSIVVVFTMFALTQYMINWNLSSQFNATTVPNQRLLVAYSERWSMDERCEALTTWASGVWPEYYEAGMINGLQAAYQNFHGEPFCDGFVRPP
jgi:hypothetical protein